VQRSANRFHSGVFPPKLHEIGIVKNVNRFT
jgi:hypothetical protein